MANYFIHACPKRMWYVVNYLIPSMEEQGIKNIETRCDAYGLGNLESCMRAFDSMPDDDGGTWHLQDDVIVCRDFRKLTEQYDDGIVAGYTHNDSPNTGEQLPTNLWYSFPCIRIPNKLARECATWYYSYAKYYAKYWEWVHMGKCDDNFFREFMIKNYPDYKVTNLVPNLVDHVDYLIGGSIVNVYRGDYQMRAAYFEDGYLVDQLAHDLSIMRNI